MIIQLRVAVVLPFEAVATKVLIPVVKLDEEITWNKVVPDIVEPFNFQSTTHELSPVTIPKVVDEVVELATRIVDVDGVDDEMSQVPVPVVVPPTEPSSGEKALLPLSLLQLVKKSSDNNNKNVLRIIL